MHSSSPGSKALPAYVQKGALKEKAANQTSWSSLPKGKCVLCWESSVLLQSATAATVLLGEKR